MSDLFLIIIIGLVTFIANIIGTVSGFGVSTIMTPTLLILPTPMVFPEVVLFVCIIHWFHDIWRLLFFGHAINKEFLYYFAGPSIIGTFIGALFVGEQFGFLPMLLGVFLIGYVIFLFFAPTFQLRSRLLDTLIGGGISGFLAGLFGIRGAIRSAFLTAYNLPKEVFIGTTAAISLLIDSTRLGTYLITGIRLHFLYFIGLLLFIPASFLGSWLGQKFLYKIPQHYFRIIVAIFLLLAGIRLVLMPWTG